MFGEMIKKGAHHMRHLIAPMGRLSVCILKRSLLAAGLGLFMLSGVSAQDITVTEQTFGCIPRLAEGQKYVF